MFNYQAKLIIYNRLKLFFIVIAVIFFSSVVFISSRIASNPSSNYDLRSKAAERDNMVLLSNLQCNEIDCVKIKKRLGKGCSTRDYFLCIRKLTPTGIIVPSNIPIPTPQPTLQIQIEANQDWPGDYKVTDKNGKTLIYLSSGNTNHGWITALTPVNGNKNLINNISSGPQVPTGTYYDHFIVWLGDDKKTGTNNNWGGGNITSNFQISKWNNSQNKYLEWSGLWYDSVVNFNSSVNQKISPLSYDNDTLLVIKTSTSLIVNSTIENFKHLYVELGWTANDYQNVLVSTSKGIKTVDVGKYSQPAEHFFDGLKLNSSNYIVAYKSSTLDGSMAIVFDKLAVNAASGSYFPYKPNEVFFRSWNTDGIIDNTDTMELHITNPAFTYTDPNPPAPFILKSGSKVTLDYYVVINNNPNISNWVPTLSQLQGLFTD